MNGRAHGKIILIGEHSVVYGHPAIALPLKAGRAHCSLEKHSGDWMGSRYYEGPLDDALTMLAPLNDLIRRLRLELGIGPFKHVLKSNIPIGAGLGSSASIAAAIIRAYYAASGTQLTDEHLFEWIQFSEKNAHDNPSGIDALTVMHEHPWYFTKTHREALQETLGAYLVVADTLERTATKDAVRHVASQKETQHFSVAMKELEQHAIESRTAYQKRDLTTLGEHMNGAMEALASLGLSTAKLDAFIKTAKLNGALAAKLSGGGMGGCIIALCRDERDAIKVQNALETSFETTTWITKL